MLATSRQAVAAGEVTPGRMVADERALGKRVEQGSHFLIDRVELALERLEVLPDRTCMLRQKLDERLGERGRNRIADGHRIEPHVRIDRTGRTVAVLVRSRR